MSSIYMIRHAKPASTWGQSADLDPGLDEIGREQALSARDALLAANPKPTAVVSSPLRRCRETAQPLADALGVEMVIDPRVGEIPTPAALTHDERAPWLKAAFGGTWTKIEGDLDYDQWRRGVAAAVADYPDAAVFSHFVALNGVVSLLQGREEVMAFEPDHASITIFDLSRDGLVLSKLGRQRETTIL